MQRAFRWQALALAAGLMVSMEAGAKEEPAKVTKPTKAAAKPAAAKAPEASAVKASEARALKASEASAPTSSGGGFGRAGHLVIGSDTAFDFGYTTAGDYGYLRLQPSLDYFLQDRLSLGASAILGFTFGDQSASSFGLTLRGGYNLPFGERLSLWPRFGLGFLVLDALNLQGGVLGTQGFNFQIEAYSPLLIHVTQHFFLGVGPRVGLSIGKEVDVAFSLNSTLGGYF